LVLVHDVGEKAKERLRRERVFDIGDLKNYLTRGIDGVENEPLRDY